MSELKDKLKAKRKEIEAKFDNLDDQRKKLVDQRSELDRQIAAIAQEQVRLQGEFRAIEDLSNEKEDKSEPKLTIPKKK